MRCVHTRTPHLLDKNHHRAKAEHRTPKRILRRCSGRGCTRCSAVSTVLEKIENESNIPFEVYIGAGTVLLDSRRRLVKLADVAFRVTDATAVQRLE